MNSVLERIVRTQQVSDGVATLPLRYPGFPVLAVAVDPAEGDFLQQLVQDINPLISIEIGCAYGVSTLYLCDALSRLERSARHIVIDPFQSSQWHDIGRKNVTDAGFGTMVDFREDYSERVLPQLLREGLTIDFAFVDGWHSFDQVLVEFYFLNKLLRVGGVIAFDDADRRSVNRAIRHAPTYPAYRPYGTSSSTPARITWLGRGRRVLTQLGRVARVLRPDVVRRDWDLGIHASCVAIQKVAEDRRSSGWDASF